MNGILYSAIGEPFLQEALVSARSSLRFNPVEHLVWTDQPGRAGAEGVQVRDCEPSANPYADKIRSMIGSPFQRTIYLDTDTYVLDDITALFDLLDRFDIAACHSPGYRGLADPGVPAPFYELNTGIVVWRDTPGTLALLAEWLATYERWALAPPFADAANSSGYADQPAFRRCVWSHAVDLCVLGHEYCYRTPQCGQVAGRVRVIHGRHRDYERVAAILNREQRARVFPRGTFTGM